MAVGLIDAEYLRLFSGAEEYRRRAELTTIADAYRRTAAKFGTRSFEDRGKARLLFGF